MPDRSSSHGVTPVIVGEPLMNRGLAGKIHDAIAHALGRGHGEIASRPGLIYHSIFGAKAVPGYASSFDDELRSWLDRRFT